MTLAWRTAEPLTLLTSREREVADLITEGLSNKEIAYKLNISSSALKDRISRIHMKLGTINRVEVAVIITSQGKKDEHSITRDTTIRSKRESAYDRTI